MINSNVRRERILDMLRQSASPVSASKLAGIFEVSRQIVVGDIALLRAAGEAIVATPKGYMLDGAETVHLLHRQVFVSCHSSERTEEELNICVDNGCRVVDVVVEHPIYGQLTGVLDVSSRYDVKCFVEKTRQLKARALSELTDGIHVHTLEYRDEDMLQRTLKELHAAGFMYEN